MTVDAPVRAERVRLVASDGHGLDAWRAEPAGAPRGGVVVLHEIFGLNAHIREVAEGYARLGYLAVAPALFDRARRGVELGYEAADVDEGRRLRAAIEWDATLRDVQAAIDAAAAGGRVAALGYCWGGTLAFLAATRLGGVACAVSYYGGQTVPFAAERARVPVLMHFGELDPRIPPGDIAAIRAGNPQIEVHLYPADHGFNCDHRKEWHAPSASAAMARTRAFLRTHLEDSAGEVPGPARRMGG